MKILWVSNASFTRTGYGTGTRAICGEMVRRGEHQPIVLAYWGLGGATIEVDGIEHVSAAHDIWANDCIVPYTKELGCDIALIHRDIWVNDLRLGDHIPLASWHPLDHTPADEKILSRVKATRWNATMSRWAVDEFRNAGYDVAYLPHSIDPAIFYYNRSRAARERHTIPEDVFLITMVAANKGAAPRKGWPQAFQAIAEMQRRHPDVWFYLHTLVTEADGGPNLQALGQQYEWDGDRGRFLSPVHWNLGISNDDLATFYAMSDVLLNPSYGEGFGIPILEAQAVGTPVVTTNCSSMPEITWNGYSVDGDPFWIPYAEWRAPRVGELVDALERVYAQKDSLWQDDVSKSTANDIAAEWTDAHVYETYAKPWLAKIEQDLALLKGGELQLA